MSYSKFLDDWSKVREEYLEKNPTENVPWDLTEAMTRDKWIAEKKFDEFVAYVLENYDSGNCIDLITPFGNHLIEIKEYNLFKKIWKGVIRINISTLWDYVHNMLIDFPNATSVDINKIKITDKLIEDFELRPGKAFANEKNAVAYKRYYTLKALSEFINGLERFNDENEISKMRLIIENVQNLQKPTPTKSTDKRKIDEKLFWELITISREESEDKFEFIEILTDKLSAFKPNEIRKFARIFETKFQELNTWDNWAFVYIVRRGCGDNEFDYFKAWVISKGQETFNKVKEFQQKDFKELIGLDDPQLEEMLYLAEEAYELKTSELMTPIRVKKQNISGTKWTEEKVCEIFPEICKQFNYK